LCPGAEEVTIEYCLIEEHNMSVPDRILVVEDNELNSELIQALLTHYGFEVIVARDAAECYEFLAHDRPDLVLMDVQLGGESGLDITRKLRSDVSTRDLPIVALTAYAMAGDAKRVIEAGCDGYLTKPIDTRTLPAKIRSFLNGRTALSGLPHETS
jgi:CheY-like chemotaxis protein